MAESDAENPSWLKDVCNVTPLPPELQVPPYRERDLKSSQSKIMWGIWRIWSRAIYEQLEEHHNFQDRLFSNMLLGKLFCDYLTEFTGSFNHKESFLALEVSVINQPITKHGQKTLIIDAVWKRCADNWSIPEESRRWTILVYNELAQLFQYILKVGDLLMIWGGRVHTTENNRMLIMNHQFTSRAVISMYRHDGMTEPTKTEDGTYIAPFVRSEEFSMCFRSKKGLKDCLTLVTIPKVCTIEQTNYVSLPIDPRYCEGELSTYLENSESVNGGDSEMQTKSKRKQTGQSSETNSTDSLSKVDHSQVTLENENSTAILDNGGVSEMQTKSKRKQTGQSSETSSTGSLSKVDQLQDSLEDKNSTAILDNVGVSGMQTKSKRKQALRSSRTTTTRSSAKVTTESCTEVDDSSAPKASTSSQKNAKAVNSQLERECFVRLERLKDLKLN